MMLNNNSKMIKVAYDNLAEKYHNCFKDEMNQKEFDRLYLDEFSNRIGAKSKILDAGCGPSGHIGKYLYDKGHDVVGIDISPKCIEIAKNYNPLINFRTMDINCLDFQPDYFDVIISFYSIMYTPKNEIKNVFKEFYRVLKPNGLLLIVTKEGNREWIDEDYWDEGNPIHYALYSEEELKKTIIDNHFELIDFQIRKPYDFEFKVDRLYSISIKN